MKTKKTKEGISLIVLVLTIVIMIILAGVIIINLNNSGIIDRAKTAVSDTNLKQVQELANVAWGEAYLEGTDAQKADVEYLKATIETKLLGKGMTAEELSKYTFDVTTGGVKVTVKTGDEEETPDEGGTETPEPEEPTVTPFESITPTNYGDVIEYTVEGLTKEVEVEIEDEVTGETNTDYVEVPREWKIFYKDDNYLYIIFAERGYEGKEWDENDSTVNSTTAVEDLLDTTTYSTFTAGIEGAEATGAPTLEMWVASWNAKGYTNISIAKNDSGYLAGLTTADSTFVELNDTTGARDKLFFPDIDEDPLIYSSSGYWLATVPGEQDVESTGQYAMWVVNTIGTHLTFEAVSGPAFDDGEVRCIRPVVKLPSSVITKNADGNYAVIQ